MSRGRADGLTLVGAGSDAWTPEQWLERIEESFADADSQAEAHGRRELKRIRETTAYHQLDVTADGQLAGLLAQLEGPVAIYFALPPRVSQLACEALAPGPGAGRDPAGDGEAVRFQRGVRPAPE